MEREWKRTAKEKVTKVIFYILIGDEKGDSKESAAIKDAQEDGIAYGYSPEESRFYITTLNELNIDMKRFVDIIQEKLDASFFEKARKAAGSKAFTLKMGIIFTLLIREDEEDDDQEVHDQALESVDFANEYLLEKNSLIGEIVTSFKDSLKRYAIKMGVVEEEN